ncbi:MAG TPA: two-component regulator propeller domain-containing protein [Haliangiales bacterium]|nr:two-component regulator propeller domain-containing protein [Haliangiales bacterium]
MSNNRWALAAAGLLFCDSSSGVSAASSTVPQVAAPYTIDVWETEDGLPQNSVIAMTQTRDGYLWLGTLKGLVRFDGIRFTVFDESNTPGLESGPIVSLFEDSQGNLWMGTETAGVALLNNGRVKSLGIGRGTREGRLMAVCEDPDRAVWLYTANGQLCRHHNGGDDVWNFGADNFSNCRALIAERSGPLWVGVDWGLFAINPAAALDPRKPFPVEQSVPVTKLDFLLASQQGGYWRLANGRVQKCRANRVERDLGPYPWSSSARVSAACEDLEGNLVVGTLGGGVWWFDAEGKAACLSMAQGLSHNYILSLHMDRDGALWVGTDGGGLNRVKRQVFDVLEETRGLTVRSVCEDDQGGLWVGFNAIGLNTNGAGFWKGGVLQRFGTGQGLMNPSVWAVFVDRKQRIWAGTWDGLYQLQNGRFQRAPGMDTIRPVVLAVHQDRSGRLWLGTRSGLVRWDEGEWKTFTTREGLSGDEVQAIADDSEGNLWVGTRGGGLNRLRDGLVTAFHRTEGLPSEYVSSLYVDEEGILWIGTDGGGLGRLQGGSWTRYTTREGLISNRVGYLVEDSQGYLWMGSIAGLMRVPKKALNDFALGKTNLIPCRAYGKPDGLPTSECTLGSQPGACRTRDGRLWFATIKGLVSVNPSHLHPNTNPPPVMIESVLIEGREQNTNNLRAGWLRTVTVPADKERLEIYYTSLNLAAPDRARFKYRLEGHEKEWTEAGNTRVVRFSKLPPGRYRFHVTACNEDGVWNSTGSALALIVEPPFWRTWWFLTATAVGLLGGIVALVHYVSTQQLQRQLESLRQQEALEKERSRIARDIHDQLGASLTQVALLSELVEGDKESPAEVEAHARQISQTARDTTRVLDEIVWTVNPSNDTLDGLITYVCQNAQEYLGVAGLRYRLDVPAQLPGAAVSPEVRHNVFLASKEAITNVVRHAQASAVWIRLRLDATTIILEIEDNGRGVAGQVDPTAPARNGLRNMRKRMEGIGGSFALGPAPGGGTLVRLIAPIGNH